MKMTMPMEPVTLPVRFTERMGRLLGEEYSAFAESLAGERIRGLRLNTLKEGQQGLEELCKTCFLLTPVPWCQEGYYYPAGEHPGRHPYHEAGLYYIQEPSAMSVVELLSPEPGERILDLCAAPGGKTSHAAQRLGGMGLLVSNEIHPARAKILSQNVERMGVVNGIVTREDSGKLAEYFPEFFHKIIVDAPCSGEGMFRKEEQARTEWSQENVSACALRQQEILDNAARMLRPGGRLVYSTCTFAPEEDEETVAAFLENHPEFRVAALPESGRPSGLSKGRPEWTRKGCRAVADTFRIWPHLAKGEGHYLALLEKKGPGDPGQMVWQDSCCMVTSESDQEKFRRMKLPGFWRDRPGIRLLGEALAGLLARWPDWLAGYEKRLYLYGDQIYLVPEGMCSFEGLRVLRPGLHLGTMKKNRFEPSHALALALTREQAARSVSFGADSREIAAYLGGQTLEGPGELKGWTLVCVDGYSLGWAKATAGTLKNHYPKGLRIQNLPQAVPRR